MADVTEVKFSDLQMEQRYKKLERALKLACLKNGNRKEGDESWPLLTSPSISSITMDAFDSSTNIPSSQTSRYGSVVVSSSNNFRNTLLKKRDSTSNKKAIATSSVKKFDETVDFQTDRLSMPPPHSDNSLYALKKSVNVGVHNETKTASTSQSECYSSNVEYESPQKNRIYEISNIKENYNDTLDSLPTSSNHFQYRRAKSFTRWRVMLSEREELIVKGILECGRTARSKPIKRRLSATVIESCFKHLYHLQGNIVDNDHILPDYVRGKFCNGFPDDWQNVYQIWKTFVQQGCKITFRWPTPITDSDDDIKSEVTDLTYACLKSPEDKERSTKSFNELRTPQTPKGDIQNYSSRRCTENDSSTQTCVSDETGKSFDNTDVQISLNRYSSNKENYKQKENVNTNYFSVEEKRGRLKDKLNVIVNNLTDENCPQECISKIIEIFDCLNYVVSYGSVKECLKSGQEKRGMQERCNETSNKSQQYCQNESIPLQIDVDCSETNYKSKPVNGNYSYPVGLRPVTMNNKMTNNLLHGKGTFMKVEKNKDTNAFDSESETYAGVPKISVERLLQRKGTLIKPCKREITKKSIHQKHDTTERQRSSVSPVKRFAKPLRSENICSGNFNHSSVTILEDETEFSEVKRTQWEMLNKIMRDGSTHEVQEHFVKENSTPLHRTSKNVCNSLNPAENNVHNITITRKSKHVAAEVNSHTETFNDDNDDNDDDDDDHDENESMNYQHRSLVSHERRKKLSSSPSNDAINKASKAIVISSVPVDMEIKNKESKSVGQQSRINSTEQENRYAKELNEETTSKGLIEKESPSERTHATEISNKKFSSHNKRGPEEPVSVQSSNIDSTILKKSVEDNSEVFTDTQDIGVRKPRSLSAWRPRVLCEPELQLIFEGNLLNDAGHVTRRKFKTDPVLRRIAPKLIETIQHELYELVGDLNDTKHVVPKKLSRQCRNGCPTRIDQFCKAWQSLHGVENVSDTTMGSINVAVSSKGRRIIPPLCYWTGERVVLKDNNPTYNPGSHDSNLSFTKSKNLKTPKKRSNSANRRSNLEESESATTSFLGKSFITKTPNKLKKPESSKRKEVVMKNKRRADQQRLESSDSSDSTGVPVQKRRRLRTHQQTSPICMDKTNRWDQQPACAENPREPYLEFDGIKLKTKSMKFKDIGNAESSASSTKLMFMNHQVSAGRYRDIVCTYYQDIPPEDDMLSDDQVTHV